MITNYGRDIILDMDDIDKRDPEGKYFQNEVWKSVPGYEGIYEISSNGKLRSLDRIDSSGHHRIGRLMKPGGDKDGYLVTTLTKHAIEKRRRIHQLVLEAFVGTRPENTIGCHIDGNILNNNVSNLRWGTAKSNSEDMIKHGREYKGQRHWNIKINESIVREIFNMFYLGMSKNAISKKIGITDVHVGFILRRKSWKHLKI